MISWKQKDFKNVLHKKNQIYYLSRIFNIDPFVVQMLFLKGMYKESEISNFFFPNINDLHDPFLMNDMKKAVIRIIKAIQQKEKIMIFGDYDVDGITSTALLYKALEFFKANISYNIPLRKNGYGLLNSSIDTMRENENPSLIITVDNGSTSKEVEPSDR